MTENIVVNINSNNTFYATNALEFFNNKHIPLINKENKMNEQLKIFDVFKTVAQLNEYVDVSKLGDVLKTLTVVFDKEPPLTSPENVEVRLVEVLNVLKATTSVTRWPVDDQWEQAISTFLADTNLLKSTSAVLFKLFGEAPNPETGGGLVEPLKLDPATVAQIIQLLMTLFGMFKR